VLEHFEHGRAVAYDARRGRLWAICEACGRWSLEPLESRWEAIAEIDRLTTDRGRTISSTANIAWIRAEPLTVVRVGAAVPREEAWWRYGRSMLERSRQTRRTERWGKVRDSVLISLLAGFPLPSWRDPKVHVERKRLRQFGKTAWPLPLSCAECGAARDGIPFTETADLRLQRAAGGSLELGIFCDHCGRLGGRGGGVITGIAAEHLLRRVLAFQNYRGGTESEVEAAACLVEQAGAGDAYATVVARSRHPLGLLSPTERLALEIGTNSGHEKELLDMEASVLERRWREEEEIATIVDSELS
jgi:hypothetical protein